jgi:hypothetical protein
VPASPDAPPAPALAIPASPLPGVDVPGPSPAATGPAAPAAAPFVADAELRHAIERLQRDALLYDFLYRATERKSRICALDQAPSDLCGRDEPPPPAAATPMAAPGTAVGSAAPGVAADMMQPAPLAPPFRVVAVAGSTDAAVVVTLLDTDLQQTHTLRAGGWIDQDYQLLAADFSSVTIRGHGRTHRLPVTRQARWGARS